MSVAYKAVQWNGHKKLYDLVIAGLVLLMLLGFIAITMVITPAEEIPSEPILLLRATGTTAIVMLHVILLIGPLARISNKFNVLLYNRRHLGVSMFLVALIHGVLATLWYGFGGVYTNPLETFLASGGWDRIATFPYEPLGMAGLAILFLMAATSHDFWLKNLSPKIWKSLHMLVYMAYALLLGHVLLGAAQTDKGPVYPIMILIGFVLVAGMHLFVGIKENRPAKKANLKDGWVEACPVNELKDKHGHVIKLPDGKRIALFRDGDRIAAMSNVCAHQGGPIGEGAVLDGCVTCPWHGYQYKFEDATSPPPYTEKLPTYPTRIEQGIVWISITAQKLGSPCAITIKSSENKSSDKPAASQNEEPHHG